MGLESKSERILNAIKIIALVLSLNQQSSSITVIPVSGQSKHIYRTTIQQILEKHKTDAL